MSRVSDEDEWSGRGPFLNGRLRVQRGMCRTCIFRPGNLMSLRPGRVQEMVAEARGAWSVISCHDTLDDEKATCAGYAALRPTPDCLQLAGRMGIIELVDSSPVDSTQGE